MNNLSLATLAKIAFKHIRLLLISGLIAAILAFSYCSFIAVPKYSATGSLVVTNGLIDNENKQGSSSQVTTADFAVSYQLAKTVIDVLKTNEIYKELANNYGNKYTYSNLSSRAVINRRNDDSLFIDVTFTASSPEEAQNLTNKFLELTPDYVSKFISGSTNTVTTSAERASKTYPHTVQMVMFSAIVVMFIVYAIIYIIYAFHNTIESADDINANYDIPVIGEIPDFLNANSRAYTNYNSYARGGKNNGK